MCVFQTCIVTHESNGIDIITALILNDISPLCYYQMEMVLQLKVRRSTCSTWFIDTDSTAAPYGQKVFQHLAWFSLLKLYVFSSSFFVVTFHKHPSF